MFQVKISTSEFPWKNLKSVALILTTKQIRISKLIYLLRTSNVKRSEKW